MINDWYIVYNIFCILSFFDKKIYCLSNNKKIDIDMISNLLEAHLSCILFDKTPFTIFYYSSNIFCWTKKRKIPKGNTMSQHQQFENAYDLAERTLKEWLRCTRKRTKIPRIIHHVWVDLGKGPMPPESYMDSIKTSTEPLHENFAICIWSQESIDKLLTHFCGSINKNFAEYKNGIYIVDAVKLLICYRYGGYYADFDLGFSKTVECLFQCPLDYVKAVTVTENDPCLYSDPKDENKFGFLVRLGKSKWLLNNYFMAFTPCHLFLSMAVTKLSIRSSNSIWNVKNSVISVMETAGPMFVTRLYNEFKKRVKNNKQEAHQNHLEITSRIRCVREKGLIIKSPLGDPFAKDIKRGTYKTNQNAIAVHVSDATWLKGNKHVYADIIRVTMCLMVASVIGYLVVNGFSKFKIKR